MYNHRGRQTELLLLKPQARNSFIALQSALVCSWSDTAVFALFLYETPFEEFKSLVSLHVFPNVLCMLTIKFYHSC